MNKETNNKSPSTKYKSKCHMCENYDKKNDKCNEYEYESCSKIQFTRCDGYMVKHDLYNF